MTRPISPAPSVALALSLNFLIGIPIYAFGFMTSYFMNDMAGRDSHLSFASAGLIAALLAATGVFVAIVKMSKPTNAAQVLTFAVASSIAIQCVFLWAFFELGSSNLGDEQGAIYAVMMTVSEVQWMGRGFGLAGLVAGLIAVRALQTSASVES